ncbi:hypothetical protein GH714_013064 [Hevea brasiliensis]|uniref:Trichome birefringence-like C-terminal domain-containing protein n=1 Tax=Hevea brasiliensis TaxID=3981 RepID=A0A6A6MN23_HEVBR|nr:hypothetical protein GH714_013064 [Hevea brasiliensis]
MNLYLDEANDVWAAQIEALTMSSSQLEDGSMDHRTLSPAHFENGEWNRGGNCIRTRPVSRGEMKLEGDDLELYLTQVEELRRAEREGKKRGLKFRLLDINEAMVVRPDGHPNHYGHWPHENVTISDCVHWCLPGPIDTWNDFLLQMLKMESIEKPFDFKDTASPIFVAKFFFLIKS